MARDFKLTGGLAPMMFFGLALGVSSWWVFDAFFPTLGQFARGTGGGTR